MRTGHELKGWNASLSCEIRFDSRQPMLLCALQESLARVGYGPQNNKRPNQFVISNPFWV